MKLLIVESPKKATVISKFLDNSYEVLASYGHIRDLPSKNDSVDPTNHFAMVWEMNDKSKKQLIAITQAAKKADEILLATDPDREGEAIAWHVIEFLQEKKILKDKIVHRIVFNEINKTAILNALNNPRPIDNNLIKAYLTRRALDYLVGFNLSPVLWRRLPGCRSAGRVQSVALRIVSDREGEIEIFDPKEYWSIIGNFSTPKENRQFEAKLSKINGEKLTKFSFNQEKQTKDALAAVTNLDYHISSVNHKEIHKKASAPFTTSTLQQEAARKLRFSSKKTMMIAQKLYEGVKIDQENTGLITYMRTDSVNVAKDAIIETRDYISKNYLKEYLPAQPKAYKTKAKNAQEAHEAIRPTNMFFDVKKLKDYLDQDQLNLYAIIWQRMLTSQMAEAILDQTTVDIASCDNKTVFHTSGTVIKFDGFMKIYSEGSDDENTIEENNLLPQVLSNEIATLHSYDALQHFTKPPARYTEASIVKKLEELGIGRPSTYTTILSTLIERSYVKLEKRQLVPNPLGRILTAFLTKYFSQYLEYDFTAKLEEQLDDIASGKINWEKTLNDFWLKFKNAVDLMEAIRITQVIDNLNEVLAVFLFTQPGETDLNRKCKECDEGLLSLKLGKYGAFIGCSNYPKCKNVRNLSNNSAKNVESDTGNNLEPVKLGKDPQSNVDITLRKGPYGFYLQWDEPKSKSKPKRVSIPKNIATADVNFELALSLGSLPKNLGFYPNTESAILVNQGRYGPYIKYKDKSISIPKTFNFLQLTLPEAIEIMNKSPKMK